MDKTAKPRIIVKRRKHNSSGHATHGSWKIAYADFMTAMMALFLVLALIGSSTQSERQGVADYFKLPLRDTFKGGDRFSDSDSPIPGGGDDFTKIDGEEQTAINEVSQENNVIQKDNESIQLFEVGKKVVDVIQLHPDLKKFMANLVVDLTEYGLRIQILSHDNQPMFAIGSATIQPQMKAILHAIAPILNTLPNKMTLSGHTDERRYPTGDRGYSNWELSGDRANASRRELVSGGLDATKIIRILALSDTVSLNNPNMSADSNRRISLLILNRSAQQSIEQEDMVTGIDLIMQENNAKAQLDDLSIHNDTTTEHIIGNPTAQPIIQETTEASP